MSERIVVSGIGAVCAVGIGREELWDSLCEGVAGVDAAGEQWQVDAAPELVAEAMAFDVAEYLVSEKNYLDRHSELGFAAARLALDDGGLTLPADEANRVGLGVGTAWGNPDTMMTFYGRALDKGPKFAPPILFPHAYPNTTNSLLSIEYEIKGPNANFTSGATAGGDAAAWARECLRLGRADAMLVMGVDALSAFVLQGLVASGALGTDEAGPFDCERSGFIAGEGAAALVLEPLGRAKDRGAAPLAAIAGCGAGTGADLATRIESAMRRALKDAGVSQVGAVFAAANGSVGLDDAEAQAIRALLGDELAHTPITALKASLGETFAAAGPLHLAAAALAVEQGTVPPTPEADPDRTLLALAAEPVVGELESVLVNVVDPGGSAWSFVLEPAG